MNNKNINIPKFNKKFEIIIIKKNKGNMNLI